MIWLRPEREMEIILGYLNEDPSLVMPPPRSPVFDHPLLEDRFVFGDRSLIEDFLFAGRALKVLLKTWQDSGPNMGRFVRDNLKLWDALKRHSRDNPPHPVFDPDGDGVAIEWPLPEAERKARSYVEEEAWALQRINNIKESGIKTGIGLRVPDKPVRYDEKTLWRLVNGPVPRPWDSPPSPEEYSLFLSFLANPLRKRLGGPCARCGRYFLAKTERTKKVYCSHLCGCRTTGAAAVEQRRKKDRANKLDRICIAVESWAKARTELDWKQWVSRKEPDISVKFLTRAVNNGELKVPMKARK